MIYVVCYKPMALLIVMLHIPNLSWASMIAIIIISAIWRYQNTLHGNKAQGFCNDILF
jgi:hypothetical protein